VGSVRSAEGLGDSGSNEDNRDVIEDENMNGNLRALIEDRLESEGFRQREWAAAVLAGCNGREALERYFRGDTSDQERTPATEPVQHVGAYLTSLKVEGFRGIGPAQTLSLNAGPGLTLVVGRNGSGKSSFSEALEVLFTGDSKRWEGRSKIWREGWRNLHHPHATSVEAGLLVEGQGAMKVTATWAEGASLDACKTVVQPKGKPKTSLQALGWTEALVSYRPFLSYNELGSMLDEGPSKLYDALSLVLGLEDLVAGQNALAGARLDRQKALKLADQQRQVLIEQLKRSLEEELDARARACLDALTSKDWGLDELDKLLDIRSVPRGDRDIAILTSATTLEEPDAELAERAAHALRDAHEGLLAIAGTDADRARKLAALLQSALNFHESHASPDCPVCGTPSVLGPTWSETTREEIKRLRMLAAASDQAHADAEAARKQAHSLITPVPKLLDQLSEIGLKGLDAARDAWQAWASGISLTELLGLADHIEKQSPVFGAGVEKLKRAAAAELKRREDRWKPMAAVIAAWLPGAKTGRRGGADLPLLKSAEEWLKGAVADIRTQRFAPIADQAMATWQFLRQNTNVELGRIELAGSKGQRRVTLDVTVDGVAGAALGVMSQGELHSLALSLFLPRATLAESPFRFVVIDDPVQSMDPARVDGLAKALEDIARLRQVIVFTHDERLPEAVRRMDIKATILSVTRRPKSVIEVRTALTPVRAHIEDALALVHTTELPPDIMRRLVPGFCRAALEASFMQVVRRRRLAAGQPHGEIEEELASALKLTPLAALALFDNKERGGDVMKRLNQFGPWAGDAFRQCKEGAHEAISAELNLLINDVEKLTERVLTLQ
jgi:ABC-type Mn2+/Zn2+ transport system ATPase subunit